MSSRTNVKLVPIPARIGIRLTCLCGYTWIYLGTRAHASCSRCRSRVTVNPKDKENRHDCNYKNGMGLHENKKPKAVVRSQEEPSAIASQAQIYRHGHRHPGGLDRHE